jgi:hypothetical protein
MSFLQPKAPKPVPTVDPNDTANRLNNSRTKRIESGGRNATFLAQTAAAAASNTSPNTLTGLNG